jgi:anti-sigma B factor antagonist
MLAALSLTKGFADSTGPLDLPFEIAGRRESIEKGKAVPEVRDISASDVALLGDESATSSGDPGGKASASVSPNGSPCLRVRIIDRHSVVDLLNAEQLFDSDVIQNLSVQLHRLIEEGHTRLLLNLSGVRYMSSDVLGTLVMLQRRIEHDRGCLGLCGLASVLQDMVRICRLGQVFDIYTNLSEALGTDQAHGDEPPLE